MGGPGLRLCGGAVPFRHPAAGGGDAPHGPGRPGSGGSAAVRPRGQRSGGNPGRRTHCLPGGNSRAAGRPSHRPGSHRTCPRVGGDGGGTGPAGLFRSPGSGPGKAGAGDCRRRGTQRGHDRPARLRQEYAGPASALYPAPHVPAGGPGGNADSLRHGAHHQGAAPASQPALPVPPPHHFLGGDGRGRVPLSQAGGNFPGSPGGPVSGRAAGVSQGRAGGSAPAHGGGGDHPGPGGLVGDLPQRLYAGVRHESLPVRVVRASLRPVPVLGGLREKIPGQALRAAAGPDRPVRRGAAVGVRGSVGPQPRGVLRGHPGTGAEGPGHPAQAVRPRRPRLQRCHGPGGAEKLLRPG